MLRTNWKWCFTSEREPCSLSLKGRVFGLELAVSTLRALLDCGWSALLSGEHSGSALMETRGCLFCRLLFVGGVQSFSERPCGVAPLLGSSRWTRCFLLADEAPTNGTSCFFSGRLNAAACTGWLFSAGTSSKKSSDIRDSSSSTSISSSTSFLFLLRGSWAFIETAPGWGADLPTNTSAADSCDATDADVCGASILPEESRTGRLDSEAEADESSSKGLHKSVNSSDNNFQH